MEQTATGSSTVPQYTSKLQELLTADRSTLRSDLAYASNAASLSRGSTGDDGTKSSDAVAEEYRNPRKRLLLSSMNASESEKTTDNQNEKGKKIMKKTEVSTGESTNRANEGPDSFKVAPLILKKYYPSAVQSAECEEFLVSLTAEDSLIAEDPYKSGAKDDADKSVNGNSKPLNYDYEYMGAQIDKLLGMSDSPSPSSSAGNKAAWKASRRQRRHQCEVCPKSYSTEDDLKSHILSHSEGENAKPFECEHCDKKFKWVASLKGHKRKVHKEMRSTPGTEDEHESSEGEESSPSQADTPAPPDAVTRNPEAASKSVPAIPTKLSLQEQAQSFESVVSKMLSSGLVSHNQTVNNTVEKSLPPRRKCSTAKEKPEAPSRRSTTRKDSKSSNNNNMKEVNDAKRKIVATEEADNSPSVTLTPNRTSLRRNIQRPKWLADTDLVTDYEFPRGTNIMRTGNGNTPSASTTPTMNGSQAKARTTSTESNEDSGKNQKSDRGKVNPPPSLERKVKEDGTAPKVVKAVPKKETVKKAKVIKKEPKKKRVTKSARAAAIKDGPKPNEPAPELAPAPAPEPAPTPANESPSPTKHLSTKILRLSLSEENNEEAAPPIAAAVPAKNSRKRPKSDSPRASKGSGGRKKPKRKLTEEVDVNKAEESPSLGNATLPNPTVEPIDSASTPKIEPTDVVVESKTASNSMSVQAGEGIQPKKLEDQIQNTDKSSTDSTDAMRMEEAAVNVQSERSNEQVHTSTESVPAQNNEIVNGLETATKTMNSPESNKTIQNDNSVLPFTIGSNGSIIETQKIETQILATTPFSFFNCQEAVTFADLAKGTPTPAIPKVRKSTTETPTENSIIVEESSVEPEVQDRQEGVNVNGAKLPNLTNDEDMPVLKPEASSSAAVSRSESFAERMESIDEDVSNSSNHSIVPQHAPVLSKEAIPPAANGVIKVPMDCNTVSSESTVIDPDEPLGELPMIEGEEEGIGMRRDRSDSLSMRSCGSGSPSEKIKTLDDTASKDKEKAGLSDDDDDDDDDDDEEDDQDQECLPDSDSNDSLMSEFSELAAQLSEKTDGAKVKEECIRFLTNKVSANSMWLIRKELKRLKKDKNYFKFGKLSPLAAGLMHDIFCQSLR